MQEEKQNNQEIDIELCPGCLYDNEPGTHFCIKCNAPLSSLSTIGPWERLQAERHIYTNAASNPQGIISVIGIWLIFGTIFLSGMFCAILLIYSLYTSSLATFAMLEFVTGSIISLFMIFIGGFVTIRTTVNYWKKRKKD